MMKKLFIFNRTVTLLISIFLLAIVLSSCNEFGAILKEKLLSSKNEPDKKISKEAQIIIEDMTLAPDAPLHGTEGLSWGLGEAAPQPMPVPAKNYKGEWFQAMTCWGQVYIPRTGSTATNTRCQIRNVTTKLLRTNGKWETVQSGAFGGSAYLENFANNENKDAGARDESSNEGGLSVIVGVGNWAGYNYHFYTNGRALIDTNTVIGVYTTCEARLIKNDPNGVDDRANCKNLLQMGADWWLDMTVGWLPDWSANSGIGGSRSKWVTSDWQSYSMCSLLPEQIMVKPPTGGNSAPMIKVSGVMLNDTSVTVSVDETIQLTATVSPSSAFNKAVLWSSNNLTVAGVDGNGLVIPKTVGNVIITATTKDQNKTANCSIKFTVSKNLALNHNAYASSTEGSNVASNAFDGNASTRWGSVLGSDPQWIYVDLGSSITFNRVKLSWETAYGKSYQIQVSDDAVNWTDIYSTTTGDGGIDDLTGLSGSGRYIRMYGTQRGTGWGYALWSFEVYGN